MEFFADPLLEKVFYNLMDNALRYAGPYPEVKFWCRQERDVFIRICQDNGPGISDKDKDHIFTRGFGKNNGIGRFLIREILAITGISIQETGKTGHGSHFELIVPNGAYRPSSQKDLEP